MGIIKTKRSQVALNCSTAGSVSPVDYSALVIVELLTSLNSLKKDEDASSFKPLLDILINLVARVKKHKYTKEALITLVKEEYLSGKTVFDLAEIIGNTAFCSFPNNENKPMLFNSVSKFPPILRSDYGDEPYVASTPNEVAEVLPTVTSTRRQPKEESINVLKANLCNMPEIVALKKKYNELERPNEKYFWRWRVSTEDYEEFKRLLLKIDFTQRTREKVRECGYQLCFYIAEWYKREYDGNESVNCLSELGIEGSGLTEAIWKNSAYSHDEQPYITPDTNLHEWLYSIYVLGGFPIKYTLRAYQFSSLFDEIWGEDQNQDVISDEQLDEITQGFAGNQVVKNSLISGSLHDYYRFLRKETTMPIATSDTNKEPFVSFIRKLQEGKRKYYEQYLKPTWLLYIDSHDSLVDGEVQITFGRKDDNCYIPVECLSYWNIPGAKVLDEFEMEVSDIASGEKRSIRFSKTGPDDYPFVGWSRLNKIKLPVYPDGDCQIEVHLITKTNRYKIGSTYSFGDSRQFYKTKQPYEWSSRTDNSAHTALLFNPTRLTLLESSFHPEEKHFQNGGKSWNWLVLTEEVSLVNESSEVVKYAPRNSSLEIVFKQIPNTIKYVNFRDVIYHQMVDGEYLQTAVTLLKDNGFHIRYTPFGSDKPVNIPNSKCIISYKKVEDNRFVSWDESNPPGQGLMQLRVIYEEKEVSSTRLVYYLPQLNPIIRITAQNLILFGQKLNDIYAPGEEGYYPLERDEDGSFPYYDDVVKGYSPQSDTIPFLLGDPDENYVIINILRSTECKELYLKGNPEPIKRYERGEGIVDIPVTLRRSFEVRTINITGVSRVKCGEDVYMRFDLPHQYNYYFDQENGFRYYTAINTLVNNKDARVTFTLETSPAQYRFFYWSMRIGEEPILLDQVGYNPTYKHLTVDITPLRKNKSGIVFQSLKGVTPRHYFSPIYGIDRDSQYRRQKLMVQCFDIASEHNIPFTLFPCFKDLFSKSDITFFMAMFWVVLMDSRDWRPSPRDYTNLHRFAYEFLFDWIMLPKSLWTNKVKDCMKSLHKEEEQYLSVTSVAFKDIMLKLFRTSPYVQKDDKGYLEKIIEKYWYIKTYAWTFNRSQKAENILAQCIRGAKGDYYCFDCDYDKRLSILRKLHDSKSLFEGLYKLMAKMNK